MDWLRFGRGLYLSAACLFGDPLMKIVVEVVWPAYRYSRAVVPGFVIEARSMVALLAFLVSSMLGIGAFGGWLANAISRQVAYRGSV